MSPNTSKNVLPVSLNFLAPKVVNDLVRIGKDNDGGYVVSLKSIKDAEYLISLGLSDDWSFDKDFLKMNPKVIIHGYDHTISKRIFKRSIRNGIKNLFCFRTSFQELKKRIQIFRDYNNFFNNTNTFHFCKRVHHRIETTYDITPETIFERTPGKVFLKMDIEGGEYRIVNEILLYSSKILGMAIEFHETDYLRLVFIDSVKKLQDQFEIIHIHGNNGCYLGRDGLPEYIEITFLNKNLCSSSEHHTSLPIEGLDQPNEPSRKDYDLNFSL